MVVITFPADQCELKEHSFDSNSSKALSRSNVSNLVDPLARWQLHSYDSNSSKALFLSNASDLVDPLVWWLLLGRIKFLFLANKCSSM